MGRATVFINFSLEKLRSALATDTGSVSKIRQAMAAYLLYVLNNTIVAELIATTGFKYLNAHCQRHGLAVPRAGDRSYVTGSICDWSRSHLTYITGGC